jgi:hypothetical protein
MFGVAAEGSRTEGRGLDGGGIGDDRKNRGAVANAFFGCIVFVSGGTVSGEIRVAGGTNGSGGDGSGARAARRLGAGLTARAAGRATLTRTAAPARACTAGRPQGGGAGGGAGGGTGVRSGTGLVAAGANLACLGRFTRPRKKDDALALLLLLLLPLLLLMFVPLPALFLSLGTTGGVE